MKKYPSSLTDNQCNTILEILDDKRKRKHDLREIFDAFFYLSKTVCQWRMLPKNFPKWELVYYYFSKWKKEGIFELINEIIRGILRKKAKKMRNQELELLTVSQLKLQEVELLKEDLMVVRKSKEEKDILLLILWDYF